MDPVKKEALYVRSLYFLLFIGLGSGAPFYALFYKHVLIDGDGRPAIGLIGLIYFVMPLIGLVSSMSAGVISDKLGSGRQVVAVCCLGAFVFGLLAAQGKEPWTSQWDLQAKFVYLFVLLVFFTAMTSPPVPIVDAQTLLFLNRHGTREQYGRYRLFGTLGWSVGTILMGLVLFASDRLSWIFYGTAIAYLLLGVVSFAGIRAKPATKPIRIPWDHLKGDRMFQRFLIFVFISGLTTSMSFSYMSYFFDDVMQTPLQIGLIFGTWTLLEIPVMLFSHRLIDRLGNRWLIVCGLAFTSIWLLLFSRFTLETPFAHKIGAALLQGPAFGLTHLGIVDLVDRRAHAQLRSTYMSLMTIVRFSLAASFGGVLGSWIIKHWDGAFLMQLSGCIAAGLILFFVFLVRGHGPAKATALKDDAPV